MTHPPRILSIAGSDSSGGAGIQADIKTITVLGGYAMTAITAITAQNTRGVTAVEVLSPDLIGAQIRADRARKAQEEGRDMGLDHAWAPAEDVVEAFLLELLGDFQVTIPEVGTIKAESRPIVILTSNRTRELHDALKRRCLYTWIGFPEPEREINIVRSRLPQVGEVLASQVVSAVNRLREMELEKLPGVAETIDWTESLTALGVQSLNEEAALDTLGAVVKDRDDLEFTSRSIQDVIA